MPENIRQQVVVKHQRWILFLRHCAKCQLNVQECQLKAQCKFGKELWQHILHCASPDCGNARCKSTKALLTHYQRCKVQCLVCSPVKDYVLRMKGQAKPPLMGQQ